MTDAPEQLQGFQLFIRGVGEEEPVYINVDYGDGIFMIDINPPVRGSIVIVSKDATVGLLTLCEVKVYEGMVFCIT